MGFIIALGIEVLIYVVIYIHFNKQKEKHLDKKHIDISTKTNLIIATIISTVFFGLISNISADGFEQSYCSITDYSKTIASSNIVALQDSNQIEGHGSNTLFLGSGRIDEKMYYCCYIETDEGYQFYKISPEDEDVYIKYCSKSEQPRIEKNCTYQKTILEKSPKNSFWYSLAFYIKTKDKKIGDVLWDKEKELGWFKNKYSYTIYVPKGSIVKDYKIDLQ